MQTERAFPKQSSEDSGIPESRLREVSSRPVEGRSGIVEQLECLVIQDEETGRITRYPTKRVWRDRDGRILAFAEWEYLKDEQGNLHPKKLIAQSSINPHDTWNITIKRERLNAFTEQELTYENDNEEPQERLIKRKDGLVVSVHDISYGTDGSKKIITWTPKRQGDRCVWNRFVVTVLPDKTETQDNMVSLSGPFREKKGVLWPDARGERISFVEPEETRIAWQS